MRFFPLKFLEAFGQKLPNNTMKQKKSIALKLNRDRNYFHINW